ncbi:hypothetical protein NYE69_28245 [Paenibacillus sp. FSL R5-0527]|uniref:hypothetical protein n=1 Tax=Paenibacillus sp. FSL R5-0527 TaxID=2975321 RepID=UPI00097B93B2|nr:hypothetical protein BK140_11160 [Paenibacillus macerans]
MNLPEIKFDYSVLDSETSDYLQQKEQSMRNIVSQAYTDLGRELSEAKDALAKRGYGCFEEWYTSLGFKKDQVYRWIGRHELILANCEKRELIEDLPLSLTYEISKPSANPEAVDAVLSGNIKTHKEYKELVKSLKAAEKAAAEAEKRAKQAEAARQLAIQQHTEQQEKLLAQIDELKKRKGRSKEDEEQLGRLIKENAELTAAKRRLEEEMAERNLTMEKQLHDLRKLQEALNKTRGVVESSLGTALAHLAAIPDSKEAIETLTIFWSNLLKTLERNRKDLSELIGIELEVLGSGTDGNRRVRSATVIDIETGE